MTLVGYLPEKITIVYGMCEKRNNKKFVPAYVSDSTNKKTMDRARGTAERRRVFLTDVPMVNTIEYENMPFSNPILQEVNHYQFNKGKSWGLIIYDDFCVSMYEEELSWVIQNKGIRKGGVLNGEFVFAMINGQMRIVPVGSDNYNKLNKITQNKHMENIKQKDIILNHIYESRIRDKFLFLGWVSHYKLSGEYYSHIQKIGNIKLIKVKKSGLWYNIYKNFNRSSLLSNIGGINFIGNKSVCKDCGEFEDNVTIDDIKKEAQSRLKNFSNLVTYEKTIFFKLANMVPYGNEMDENIFYP